MTQHPTRKTRPHSSQKRFHARMLLVLLILIPTARAEPSLEFDLPAQSLAKALAGFSAKTRLQVLYDGEITDQIQVPALKGKYTPSTALEKLLQNSKYRYRFTNDKTITLEPRIQGSLSTDSLFALAPADQYPPTDIQESSDDQPVEQEQLFVRGAPLSGYSLLNASTATKTDTPIMETPVSIQVIPREVLDDQQAIRLEDVAKNVSGVLPGGSDGNYYDAFIVRGFDIGNNTYRNGFRITSNQSETVNLERLEVLKGAAAMLYGRIQPGGLLNLITKKPLETPYYSLQQQFGSFDLYRTTLDATGPVPGNEDLLYRFNLAYQNNNSFRDFIEDERIFIAPSLTWLATPSTQFNVNMEYKHENAVDDYGHPAVGNRPANIPISRNLGEPGSGFDADVWLVEFSASHAFNEDWMLKAGVNANSIEYLWQDVTNSGGVLFPDLQNNPERILERGVWFGTGNRYSQGVYLNLTGHIATWGVQHELLVGGDYYSLDESFATHTNQFSPIGCPVDIFTPTYGCVDFVKYQNLAKTAPDFNYRNDEQWGGIYFQDQITLWDTLHILGGGRYDWATVQSGFSETSLSAIQISTIRNQRFSPRVGLAYQPWPWLSVYANYTESLGSANAPSNNTGQPFAPQTATQYESGIKLAFDAITANLAFYHLRKNNILRTDATSGTSVPAGSARSRGIEFDISGKLTDQLNLIATYAFTDARFTQSSDEGVQGSRIPNVPEHQASFWARYDVNSQFSLGTGLFMAGQRQGAVALSDDPSGLFQLPGYVRWDAMAAYHWEFGQNRLTAQVNVNNILDKKYYKSGLTTTRVRIPLGEPFTVLGSLKFEY